MSSDIYALPDLSKKVNRKQQKDNEEWLEREVDIYENAEALREDHTDFQPREGGRPHEKRPPAIRVAVFCLGGLCCVLLIGIILLSIKFTSEKHQLQTRYDELSKNYSQLQETVSEQHQLQTRYDKLSKNYSQLQETVSDLQSGYKTLSETHSHLEGENKQLKNKLQGKGCPEGWTRFGCSCYFKSNKQKTWHNSRTDCQDKGAHLVVINNREEQDFVVGLNPHGESWIGLRDTRSQSGGQVWTGWEWVDSSPLAETFWAPGLPQYDTGWYAACCDRDGKWTQRQYDYRNWICEK